MMKVLKINQNSIKKAVEILKNGGVVIYPTETAYGLGVDATNQEAIKKNYQIKGRSFRKKLSVIVSNKKMVEKFCYVSKEARMLMEKFWPGPLTIILPKGESQLEVGNRNLALRIPANKFALLLVEGFGKPITATSANLSGKPATYSVDEIINQLAGQKLINLVLDAGQLPKRKVSTIIDMSGSKPKILRTGPILEKDIFKVLNKF